MRTRWSRQLLLHTATNPETMRILLDACVPRRLANKLLGHEVRTVPALGWADLDDGPLLDVMAGLFDVLGTVQAL